MKVKEKEYKIMYPLGVLLSPLWERKREREAWKRSWDVSGRELDSPCDMDISCWVLGIEVT